MYEPEEGKKQRVSKEQEIGVKHTVSVAAKTRNGVKRLRSEKAAEGERTWRRERRGPRWRCCSESPRPSTRPQSPPHAAPPATDASCATYIQHRSLHHNGAASRLNTHTQHNSYTAAYTYTTKRPLCRIPAHNKPAPLLYHAQVASGYATERQLCLSHNTANPPLHTTQKSCHSAVSVILIYQN